MISTKEIKSIDLSSFTIISTGISLVFAIIVSLLVSVGMGIAVPGGLTVSIYLVPTIIVGTLMYSIYRYFFEGFLYNTLSTKLQRIKFALKDDSEIVEISTTETAIMISLITAIEIILIYLVSVFLLPLFVNSMIQTLVYSEQQALAFSLYQFLIILSQPMTIAMIILGTFIFTFVFVLIGCYVYNIIAKRGRGITVDLSTKDNMTVLNSINPLKLAIAFAIIGCVLNIILAILLIISGGPITAAIGDIIGGVISSFICGFLIAAFYNFLAPRLGKLKIKLIGI